MTKKIGIIINPGAGRAHPVLHIMNQVFKEHGVDWDVYLTKPNIPVSDLTGRAIEEGSDVIAVYGGDGTVTEVAASLIGKDVPLGILPGGTANVTSVELGLPWDLTEACELLCSREAKRQPMDAGKIRDKHFLQRLGIGFEADMVKGASREIKDKIGSFAYALSAFKSILGTTQADYRLKLDGHVIETPGIACIVANSGNLGFTGMNLSPHIRIDDGKLDVFIFRNANFTSFISMVSSITGGDTSDQQMQHWQAREIEIEATPQQAMQMDGEIIDAQQVAAISIQVVPQAIHVLVPHQKSEA